MKKTVFCLICIGLLLSVMVVQALGAGTPTVTITTSGDVAVGETLVVTVRLNNAAAIKGVAVVPQYDACAFELVSGTWLVSGLLADFNVAAGDGVLAFDSATDLNGAIFTYTLKAKGQNGSKSVGCTVVISDSDNQNTTLSGSTGVNILDCNGDVNGDGFIDTTDAKLIMQYDLGLIGEDAVNLAAMDVNGDGLIDTTDAKLIMQYDLGLIVKFPNGQ